MARINYKSELKSYITRTSFPNLKLEFAEILEDSLRQSTNLKGVELSRKVHSSLGRHWNYIKKFIDEDEIKGIKPIFKIVDNYKKILIPYQYDNSITLTPIERRKLEERPNILNIIDNLNDREYEALSCYLCECLSASNILLTPKGNEGGIDFMAEISFSSKSHYLFGSNGPIRIVGQSKKYNSSVEEKEIKEFNQTLNDTFSETQKMLKILPTWFRAGKGIIIPWFIAHSGFQSGAITRAKNYGIVLSDSRRIAEELCMTRNFSKNIGITSTKSIIQNETKRIIANSI